MQDKLGNIGDIGEKGRIGPPGISGFVGPPGNVGDTGETGEEGGEGSKGLIGYQPALVQDYEKCYWMPTNNVDYLILPPTISSSPPSQKAESLILAQNKKGTIIACCGGVLKLAHLGILNNREATTHWMFREELERVSAEVKSTIHKTLVVDRNIVTTGGIQSDLDAFEPEAELADDNAAGGGEEGGTGEAVATGETSPVGSVPTATPEA